MKLDIEINIPDDRLTDFVPSIDSVSIIRKDNDINLNDGTPLISNPNVVGIFIGRDCPLMDTILDIVDEYVPTGYTEDIVAIPVESEVASIYEEENTIERPMLGIYAADDRKVDI